ncbi:hypothetical protein K488DRAFT_82085 [Vararia minispora EC-137]|uniref:Uncharacterized protein n=1 Tax=Vararia minispora EC-137 TaxID=1314806 RepID=A0ACB8QXU4_9AGAM|nr:hypothetical protein K488DRAFT_82085 [Vararia minispora EC-137]
MSSPGPVPRYVYKILPGAPPEPMPKNIALSDLDRADGFIHLSAGWRVPLTANMYFADARELGLLRLDADVARGEGARLAWADPGCVHMFAREVGQWARVGTGVVVDARTFVREEGRSWEEVLGAETRAGGWLRDAD